jgi:flagellar biosynthesis chaperone FliJ
MSRDPIDVLVRLRKSACEDARRALVATLDAEDAARAALHAAERAIIGEQEAASRLDAGDGAVEAFVAWLPVGRRAVAQARARHDDAVAASVQARAVLAAARASLEAAEHVIEERQAERRLAAAKQEQATLDEAGRRARFRPQ